MEKGLQTTLYRITLKAAKDDTVTVFETVNALDAFGKFEHTTLPDLLAEVGKFAGLSSSGTMATNQNIGEMVYEVLPVGIPLIQLNIKSLGPNGLRYAVAQTMGLENFLTPDPISDPEIVLNMFREIKGMSQTKADANGNYVIGGYEDPDLGMAVARAYLTSKLPDGVFHTRVPLDLYERDLKGTEPKDPE